MNAPINDNNVWTEDELDLALAALVTASASNPPTVAAVQSRLESQRVVRPRHRSTSRTVYAAMLVAAATVLGLLIPTLLPNSGIPQNTAAAATLTQAASAIRVSDPPMKSGQYRHVSTISFSVAQDGGPDGTESNYFARYKTATDVWIPADVRGVWIQHETSYGPIELVASQPNAQINIDFNAPPTVQTASAACGEFNDQPQCSGPGSWQVPTLDWVAALPTDPGSMYRKLSTESAGFGHSDESEMLVFAADALRTGMLPAAQRAALYGALARVPGLVITDTAATLDGRAGVAFAVDAGALRKELIIDPKSGAYIGQRDVQVDADDADDIPAGTVFRATATTTDIVDRVGEG